MYCIHVSFLSVVNYAPSARSFWIRQIANLTTRGRLRGRGRLGLFFLFDLVCVCVVRLDCIRFIWNLVKKSRYIDMCLGHSFLIWWDVAPSYKKECGFDTLAKSVVIQSDIVPWYTRVMLWHSHWIGLANTSSDGHSTCSLVSVLIHVFAYYILWNIIFICWIESKSVNPPLPNWQK